MVFLGKTREKGLKVLGRDKKKSPSQKAQVAQPTPTQTEPPVPNSNSKPLELHLPPKSEPIHVSLPLQITTTPTETPKPPQSPSPSNAASSLFGGSPWWVSDVTFIVEGKSIPCHKVVLQSRSEYFTKLFQNSTGEVTLEVSNFTHHIFSQFIRWVYGGKKEITPQDAPELARCARHFEALELYSLCQKILEEEAQEKVLLAPVTQQHLELEVPQSREPFSDPHSYPLSNTTTAAAAPADPMLPNQEGSDPFGYLPSHALQDGTEHPYLIAQSECNLDDLMLTDLNSGDDSAFDGMAVWSNDPILYENFAPEPDALRVTAIY